MLPVLLQTASDSSQTTPNPFVFLAILGGLALIAMLFTGLERAIGRTRAGWHWLRWTLLRIPPPFVQTLGEPTLATRQRDDERRHEYYETYGVMPAPTVPSEDETAAARAKQYRQTVQEVRAKIATAGLSQGRRYAK